MNTTGTLKKTAAPALAVVFLAAACAYAQGTATIQNAGAPSAPVSRNSDSTDVRWKVTSPDFITHTPLVQDGRVFFADWGGRVYCADAASGGVIWQKTIQPVDQKRPWRGFSGTGALGKGMLFEASAEGTLYALDLANGDVKWQTRFTDKPVAGNTGALLFGNGIVYVPVSSMDEGMDQQPGFVTDFQGRVEAYDAATGKPIWEFKTVADSGNGVAVWSGFALDSRLNTLYFGTGNNYTGKATAMSDAVVAVDAATGKLRWVKQCTANDVWTVAQPANGPDYDFGAAPRLFDAKVAGKDRKLVAAGQKSGTLWVFDRTNGTLVWSVQLGMGAAGGGFLAPPAIDRNGIYAWANNGGFKFSEAEKHLMDIAAFEPGTGKTLWKKTQAQPAWVTTAGCAAGDRYFVGSLDGMIRAYSTKTGDLAWTSAPMSSISTSLVATQGRLFFGTGIPKMFSGSGEGGVLYCVDLPK